MLLTVRSNVSMVSFIFVNYISQWYYKFINLKQICWVKFKFKL